MQIERGDLILIGSNFEQFEGFLKRSFILLKVQVSQNEPVASWKAQAAALQLASLMCEVLRSSLVARRFFFPFK